MDIYIYICSIINPRQFECYFAHNVCMCVCEVTWHKPIRQATYAWYSDRVGIVIRVPTDEYATGIAKHFAILTWISWSSLYFIFSEILLQNVLKQRKRLEIKKKRQNQSAGRKWKEKKMSEGEREMKAKRTKKKETFENRIWLFRFFFFDVVVASFTSDNFQVHNIHGHVKRFRWKQKYTLESIFLPAKRYCFLIQFSINLANMYTYLNTHTLYTIIMW